MAVKKWRSLTEEEKLETITPLLDNLRSLMLSPDSTDCVITSYSDDQPEVRNGIGEIQHLSYMRTDTFEIKIRRIKST